MHCSQVSANSKGAGGGRGGGGEASQRSFESRQISSHQGGIKPTVVAAGQVNRTRARQAAPSRQTPAQHTKQRGSNTTTTMVKMEAVPASAKELAFEKEPQSPGCERSCSIIVWMPYRIESTPPGEQKATAGVPFVRRTSIVEQGSSNPDEVDAEPLQDHCSIRLSLWRAAKTGGRVCCLRCWIAGQASPG